MRRFFASCIVALLVPVVMSGQSAPAASQNGTPEQRVADAEQSAIKALRAMNSAQASFQTACGQGYFAPGLVELGKAPTGSQFGFLTAALATGKSVTKDGYAFTMTSSEGPAAASKESCNGLPAGSLVRGYYVTATPEPGSGGRYFGTNTTGTIFYGIAPLKMADQSSDGTPLK
jgi:hypothetical protein